MRVDRLCGLLHLNLRLRNPNEGGLGSAALIPTFGCFPGALALHAFVV
jgi:hypothetical protein